MRCMFNIEKSWPVVTEVRKLDISATFFKKTLQLKLLVEFHQHSTGCHGVLPTGRCPASIAVEVELTRTAPVEPPSALVTEATVHRSIVVVAVRSAEHHSV